MELRNVCDCESLVRGNVMGCALSFQAHFVSLFEVSKPGKQEMDPDQNELQLFLCLGFLK